MAGGPGFVLDALETRPAREPAGASLSLLSQPEDDWRSGITARFGDRMITAGALFSLRRRRGRPGQTLVRAWPGLP